MLTKPLLYFDQVHLYAKNLEQQKYQDLINLFQDVSDQVGYDIIKTSNDTIMPVNYINNSGQKIVIFDDFVTEKKQKPIIDYFIQGRHKNCAVIYLSQSFNGCPKDIRLNCSHFCIYNFPSSNEQNLISRELGVQKDQYKKSNWKTMSFLYVDKPMKNIKQNFYGII